MTTLFPGFVFWFKFLDMCFSEVPITSASALILDCCAPHELTIPKLSYLGIVCVIRNQHLLFPWMPIHLYKYGSTPGYCPMVFSAENSRSTGSVSFLLVHVPAISSLWVFFISLCGGWFWSKMHFCSRFFFEFIFVFQVLCNDFVLDIDLVFCFLPVFCLGLFESLKTLHYSCLSPQVNCEHRIFVQTHHSCIWYQKVIFHYFIVQTISWNLKI